MCDRVFLENDGTLCFFLTAKKNKICNDIVDNYSHPLELFLIALTLKTCVIKPSILILTQYNSLLINIKSKVQNKLVSNDPYMLKYCLNR